MNNIISEEMEKESPATGSVYPPPGNWEQEEMAPISPDQEAELQRLFLDATENLPKYAEALLLSERDTFSHWLRYAATVLVLKSKLPHGEIRQMLENVQHNGRRIAISSMYRYTGPLLRWLGKDWGWSQQLTAAGLRRNPCMVLGLTESKLVKIGATYGTIEAFAAAFPREENDVDGTDEDHTGEPKLKDTRKQLVDKARALERAVLEALNDQGTVPKAVQDIVHRLHGRFLSEAETGT